MKTYQDFAEVYDELMDNVPYESWCENIQKLFLLQDIIQRITNAEYGSHRAVQLQLPHILIQVQNL